jgi:hypothetical protein
LGFGIVIIIVASLTAYAFLSTTPKNGNTQTSVTSTASTPTITVANSSSSHIVTVTNSITSESLNVTGCGGSVIQTINITENGTGHLCLKIYFYSQNATVAINPIDLVTIYAPPFNMSVQQMYFTITSSQNSIVIGGPQKVNEGLTTDIAIHAAKGSSGSYAIYVSGNYPYGCNTVSLFVGNGKPDYLSHNSYGCDSLVTNVTLERQVTAYVLAPNK